MTERGFTLVEVLVALLLLAVALSGLLALWPFGFSATAHSQDLAVGYSVGRQEMEGAKSIGFLALPESQLVGGKVQPIWTDYYNGLGKGLPDASTVGHYTQSAGALYRAQVTVISPNVPFGLGDRRSLHVVVTALGRNGETVCDMTTYLVSGGF